jgi:polyhydroxyalkanoate synthesis regulator phasin
MATKDDVKGLEEDVEALRKEIEGLRMATKEDLEKLRVYVDARLDDLNRRISDLYGIVKTSLVAIVVTLASTILTPLILRSLLGL